MLKMTDDDLRAIWKQRRADVPSDRAGCLTEAEWARLVSREAEGDERARAAAHIASCAECAEEYRLLQPLQSWSAELQHVVSPQQATVSGRLRTWLASFSLPNLAVAAASIVVVTHGVSLYLLVGSRRANELLEMQLAQNERALSSTKTSLTELQEQVRNRSSAADEQVQALQERLARQATPQFDVPIADLEPQYGGVVRGSSATIVSIAQTGSIVTLTLNFEPLASRSTLEVEVVDGGGTVRWIGRTVRDRNEMTLQLTLPGEGYPPGSYLLNLYDVTRGRRFLASYRVILQKATSTSR